MGLFGSLIKGALNVAISPIVIVTDTLKGDFDNTGKVIDNVIESVEDSLDDVINGDLL